MVESAPEEMKRVKWSSEAFDLLQSVAEENMVELFSYTQELAEHANRVGIVPSDIELANKLLKVSVSEH